VVEATTGVFHGLRALAIEVHGDEAACAAPGQASSRGILYELLTLGPRSVPELARRRLVSRQHVQSVVNTLVDGGLTVLVPNPAHRRSALVELTSRGRRLAAGMMRRERRVWTRLQLAASERQIRDAARVLEALRRALAARARGSH
jgi:DNA-binding MarR family transcriptional regulator